MPHDTFYVYMMTNKGLTTLYIGVTNSLIRRVVQHRSGELAGFTERYNLNRLVYFERFNDPRDAIAREKQLKRWSRKKKEVLVKDMNPPWADLAVSVIGLEPMPIMGGKDTTWSSTCHFERSREIPAVGREARGKVGADPSTALGMTEKNGMIGMELNDGGSGERPRGSA